MTRTDQEAGRSRLASALTASGALTADWLPSYRAVPRELFVPDRIWPGIADGTRQGPVLDRAKDHAAWLNAVYSDIPLTTQWDDGQHQGDGQGTTPTSSNSMPTMVFSMLADLDVQDGQRVLEIGTGPGWTSGLLAHRNGGGNVFTVEVDPAVAAQARANHIRARVSPTAVLGDGRAGWPQAAPFDRVIVTASLIDMPPALISQTRPSGVIVAPFGTEYGGEGIVRLTVGQDGTASGPFTRSSAFMRLRQQRSPRPLVDAYLHGVPWPAGVGKTTTTLAPPRTGGWLAQLVIGLRVSGAFWRAERYQNDAYTLWLYSTDTLSWATADYLPDASTFEVRQSGPRRLWDEVEAAYQWWQDNGRPGLERLGLTIGAQGQHHAWLDAPRNQWPI